MARVNWIALIGVACLCGSAGHARDDSITLIGVNSNLSEGADALEHNEYQEGIRRTADGLRSSALRREDRVGAFSNLCAGYVGTQDFDQALYYCNRALRLDSNHWHAYNNRSLAYLGLGDFEAAQRDVEKGLELTPDGKTLLIVKSMVSEAIQQEEEEDAADLPAVSSPPDDEEAD